MNERSDPAALRAGQNVTPNVQLVKPLGAGGMGAVWLAEHTGLKTKVVVKFMLGELGSSAAARARFTREAEAAAKVKSPHVVQMLDHGLTDAAVPFIVMEYLEGRDLGAYLTEKRRMDARMVVSMVSQVAKALAKVHAAGLLHRDIKPDNIFLVEGEDDLFVKLLDFGIAKANTPDAEPSTLDGGTKTGQVVGTPFYMSPEQVTAQKTIDQRSDLWSLGVVTYEALTGEKPYDGPSFGALAVRIATGEPPRPSAIDATLPPAVDAWFARACAREASNRFASARDLSEGLRAAFEGVVSLPPSVVMSDSGPRDAVSEARRIQSTPDGQGAGSQTGPNDAAATLDTGSRPSFVLGATTPQIPSIPAPESRAQSSLGRSETENAAVALPDAKPRDAADRRGPPRVAILGALVLVVVAVVMFVFGSWRGEDAKKAEGHAKPIGIAPTHEAASSKTTVSASSAGALVATASASSVLAASSASSAASSASSAASAASVADASAKPSHSGAHLPGTGHPHGPSTAAPPASATSKPTASAPTSRPSGDPLY